MIAETYTNTYLHDKPLVYRYWVTPTLLVGGNICDQADWEHLQRDFGIQAVINLEVPEANHGITTCENLWEEYLHDNGGGSTFTLDRVRRILEFAELHREKVTYVHCALGMSRSTHTAYTILRGREKLSRDAALALVVVALPTPRHRWGFNLYHESYLAQIEAALSELAA